MITCSLIHCILYVQCTYKVYAQCNTYNAHTLYVCVFVTHHVTTKVTSIRLYGLKFGFLFKT